WKPDTAQITVGDLDIIYNATCEPPGASKKGDLKKTIFDLLIQEADASLNIAQGLNLENKIVLAMAARILSEPFMVTKINDPRFTNALPENQTYQLFARFKDQFPAAADNIAVLDRVILMTPENIHLNSFMYEPIIDMADNHLKKLYAEVKQLA